MSVADRAGERVRGVRARVATQIEQAPDHRLHLLLARVAFADDRLLDLQRSVLRHRQAMQHCGAYRGAPRLAKQKRAFRIDVHENLLQRDLRRAVGGDDFAQSLENDLEPVCEFAVRGPDAPARDVCKFAALPVENAVAGDGKSRIDA